MIIVKNKNSQFLVLSFVKSKKIKAYLRNGDRLLLFYDQAHYQAGRQGLPEVPLGLNA